MKKEMSDRAQMDNRFRIRKKKVEKGTRNMSKNKIKQRNVADSQKLPEKSEDEMIHETMPILLKRLRKLRDQEAKIRKHNIENPKDSKPIMRSIETQNLLKATEHEDLDGLIDELIDREDHLKNINFENTSTDWSIDAPPINHLKNNVQNTSTRLVCSASMDDIIPQENTDNVRKQTSDNVRKQMSDETSGIQDETSLVAKCQKLQEVVSFLQTKLEKKSKTIERLRTKNRKLKASSIGHLPSILPTLPKQKKQSKSPIIKVIKTKIRERQNFMETIHNPMNRYGYKIPTVTLLQEHEVYVCNKPNQSTSKPSIKKLPEPLPFPNGKIQFQPTNPKTIANNTHNYNRQFHSNQGSIEPFKDRAHGERRLSDYLGETG